MHPFSHPCSTRARLLGLLLLLLHTATSRVHAQSSDSPVTDSASEAHADEYKALTDAAIDEYAQGRWDEALALFAKAHALSPSARTLRGLGVASFESRRYADAVRHLTAALDDSRKPLTAPLRRDAEALIARASAFVVRLRVTLIPAHAELTVDGRKLERAGTQSILLDTGPHQLVASAPHHKLAIRTVEWPPGTQAELRIQLSPPTPTSSASARQTPGPASAPSLVQHSGFETLERATLGAAAASLVLAGTAAGMREHRARQLQKHCQGYLPIERNERTCDELLQSGRVWLALAISSGALSGVLTALTIALWRTGEPASAPLQQALDVCRIGLGKTTGVSCAARF